jgi:RED-like protein
MKCRRVASLGSPQRIRVVKYKWAGNPTKLFRFAWTTNFAMNNDQFRRLVLAGESENGSKMQKRQDTSAPQSLSLGSKNRSIARTDRGAASNLFARPPSISKAERKSGKQFKSVAPKGSKLGAGYHDRTQGRQEDIADGKARRIEELEKSLKEGKIERDEFERIRDEITGGQVENTHLVKGLDWKLLERIRRGEDLDAPSKVNDTQSAQLGDIDDEFETLEKHEVKAIQKTETEKKGTLVPAPIAGKKRTRDEILAELKASRKRATEGTAAPQLGSKFRKIGDKEQSVRSTQAAAVKPKSKRGEIRQEPEPTANSVPLDHGVVVPTNQAKSQLSPDEESEDDIYADIGDEYNPLGAASDSDEEDTTTQTEQKPKSSEKENTTQAQPRAYFDDASTSVLSKMVNPLQDPAVLAALAQRSQEAQSQTAEKSDIPINEDEARLKKRAEMLATRDRDLEDMDLGFGSSRFDDAEEMAMEGSKVKLSEWKGGNHDERDGDEGDAGGKKGKKTRKPKKRKGDKNSMADVMRVIEGRKA